MVEVVEQRMMVEPVMGLLEETTLEQIEEKMEQLEVLDIVGTVASMVCQQMQDYVPC